MLKQTWIKKVKRNFLESLTLTAFADEVDPEGGNTPPTPQVDLDVLINQARKEEKDKLYPKINALKDENKTLQLNLNNALRESSTLKTKIEELEEKVASGKVDPEELENLKQQVSDLTEENKQLKEKAIDEEALKEQIRPDIEKEVKDTLEKEFEQKESLRTYRETKLTEAGEGILESFRGDITGNSEEEIDSSIESAKTKSLAVRKDLGLVDENGNIIVEKKSTNTTTKGNPQQKMNTKKYTPEYIASLDPKSEEYANFRKEMGMK